MKTDELFTALMRICAETNRSIDEIVTDKEKGVPTDFKFVPLSIITRFIDECKTRERIEEDEKRRNTPIKKFLFVEDGSVDCDDLTADLERQNPEIKVVIYRQGAREPQLKEVTE